MKTQNMLIKMEKKYYFISKKMSKFPHRATVKENKNFILNRDQKYDQQNPFEPKGLWYSINDCIYEFDMSWGNYVYELKLKKELSLKKN